MVKTIITLQEWKTPTMNMRIMLRGMWLRSWQRLNKKSEVFRKIFPIPKEFYNAANPELPAHLGIDGNPIGASGFRLIECKEGRYSAMLTHYNKLGKLIKHEIS